MLLAGCNNLVPNDGPLLTNVATEREDDDGFVYGTVVLDDVAVSSLARHDYYPLSSKFGLRNAPGGGTLGVGDVIQVTVFEAGPDGIFSTAERKSVSLRLTVQQNGRVSIPFAGSVRVSGRSVEQVRLGILAGLRGKAVEPDVVIDVLEIRSRSVVVNGTVGAAKPVALYRGDERVLDIISQAGGATEAPYETYVSISRGNETRTALLQTLIDTPRENIFVRPNDALYVSHNPRQFLALGAVANVGRHPFGTKTLNLLDATAVAGGFESARANPKAMFVFRYEYPHVVAHLVELGYISPRQHHALASATTAKDRHGRLPVVFQIDLTDADNFFVAKRFPVRADDTVYVARHATVDFSKVVDIVAKARVASTLLSFDN